jgi:ABC-type polysaccharide/polyol phosphate transport system ATPase subunit
MEMVKVDHVSIRFRLQTDRISSIKETVVALLKGKLKYREFWALQDVSFSVEKGEVLGIVGHNGAGKSTILKIISGIMKPTKGSVTLGANVVPMLELGSGFDYDLTGRENVFLNGAILGYSKEFLTEKYDEILEFSELGEFIDQPIRNYSSGMLMRLAFSIATVVNPEILICDEVLAVGDERFQAKSRKRMMELMGGGTTVLFVSHNIDQIREMSNRVVWLDHGMVKMVGDAATVCDAYRAWLNRPEG